MSDQVFYILFGLFNVAVFIVCFAVGVAMTRGMMNKGKRKK